MSFFNQSRKKFLLFFIPIYIFIASSIFFGLRFYSQKKFNPTVLNHLITGKSKFRDTTDNLCHYQILGEPKVGRDYIKINFWCSDNSKARSTFALVAFSDKTPTGILKEYARIINFDFNLIIKNNWYCTLNDQEINFNSSDSIPQASTIDCFEKKGLNKHD
jgi:hypothetical protein